MPLRSNQIVIVVAGCALLALSYIFQRIDYAGLFSEVLGIHPGPNSVFIFNRTFRLLLNDGICLAIIFALFNDKASRRMAWVVFLLELFIMLPAYLTAKLLLEGPSEISSPLLSFIHRLVVNPLLMALTIVAMAYEKFLYRRLKERP